MPALLSTPMILVIQNPERPEQLLQEALASFFFDLHIVSGFSGLSNVPANVDLVLCVWGTQNRSQGLEWLKKDARFSETPIILLATREEIREQLQTPLPIDDYVILPFDPFELKTRILLRLRNRSRHKEETVQAGKLRLHPQLMRASVLQGDSEEPLPLTHKEFKILALLVRNKNRPFTRDQLLEAVWGGSIKVLDRTVDSHICALRRKLKEHAQYIECISGVGYRFRITEDEAV